ncbi:UNVERIFIED_CONTAM: hypothetical protein GTU68_032385, partial [Idotea baltica]|nr:hypothetical protein [Idotea baltica]
MVAGQRILTLRKCKSFINCHILWPCQIRAMTEKVHRNFSQGYKYIKPASDQEQRWKNSNQKTFYYSSYAHVIYFGIGVGVGVSLYNYLKERSLLFLPDKVGTLFLPTVHAAAPIYNPVKEEEKINKGSRHSHNFIADVVEKVSDGVVYIEIKDHRRKDYQGRMLSISNGSGFVVDQSGLILTNAHVVANKPRSSSIIVRMADGKEYEGKIEELDVISDLALVRISKSDVKPLTLGMSKDIRPGEFVVALGSPLSLSNTITSGVVSSIGRASKDLGLRGRNIDYIQTDAAITFGNSGGPLVNLDGEVIGINSMKVTSGISFAIPVDYAKEFLRKADKKRALMAKHRDEASEDLQSRRRYLGITMLSLTPEIIAQMQQRNPGSLAGVVPDTLTHGVLIWKIVVGSPGY